VRAKLGYPFRFVELAQEINAGMPEYVVRRIQDLLNEGSKSLRGARVLLLGVTYKPDIADQRESPAKPLAQQLLAKGADVVYHDPHVLDWHVNGTAVTRADDLDTELAKADVSVLLQNHSSYDLEAMAATANLLFDTRGTVRAEGVARL